MRMAVLVLFALASAMAQRPFPRPGQLEQAVEAERGRQGAVGLTAAVAVNGALKWIDAFGKADLEHNVDTRPDTLFRTASIAKPMTAVAALQLYERGKLDLDAPIQKYVPGFPEKPWPVTVRLLLSHLGGIRTYRGEETDSVRHYNNIIEPLKIFSADPLAHAPRSKYLYSTYGYNLAGAAVEAAANMPFLRYLEEHVWDPAHMEYTRDDDQREIIPNRARGYARSKDGKLINSVLADISNKIPGGGLLSTVGDLVDFANAWEKGILLKRSTMLMQVQRQQLLDGSLTNYGLGWNLSRIAGHASISHGGAQHGTRTIVAMFPDLKLTIAVMTNSEFCQPEKFVEVILRTIENQPVLSTGRIGNGVRGVVAGANKRP